MATLLILLFIIIMAVLFPSVVALFKGATELLILLFYAVALAIIAVITIRSFNHKTVAKK